MSQIYIPSKTVFFFFQKGKHIQVQIIKQLPQHLINGKASLIFDGVDVVQSLVFLVVYNHRLCI